MSPPPLPIDEALPRFLEALATKSALVLVAPPGAGKTTRVPPAMLDARLAGDKQILVLQPRRMAARAVARRIAFERGVNIGGEIGFQVRFDRQAGADTRLLVATEGVALRMLQEDPFLERVGAVVFDEFHERSLNADLALGMVRRIQETLRPDLKIVLMSATIDGAEAASLLGGCPVIESAGRAFPVEIRHTSELARQSLADTVTNGVLELLGQTNGHVLAFLPGMREIRQAASRIDRQLHDRESELHILHGELPAEKQDAVLASSSRRKVILATNVAETSLTIDGVTAVVDSGLARQLRYDSRTGLDRLELSPISQASADQRAGRAGRTAPGVCLRLWPAAAHRSRPAREAPEIVRVDLAGALLQLLCWEDPNVATFPWVQPPPEAAVQRSLELLQRLGAADGARATPLGRRMALLPAHPRLARLLLAGRKLGVADKAATAAALLSERDPFRGEPLPDRAVCQCDLAERIERLSKVSNRNLVRAIESARDQFLREIRGGVKRDSSRLNYPVSSLSQALLAAFPDRVARRRAPGDARGLMVGGVGVKLAPESVVRDAELFLCLDVEANRAHGVDAVVRIASAVPRESLAAEHLRNLREVFFDIANEKVIGRRRVYYLDLLLEETPDRLDDQQLAADLLIGEASARWPAAFPSDNEALAGFIARVRWLGEWLPDLDLPPLDETQLKELLPQLAAGRRSFAELRQAPWLEAVRNLLTYQQLAALDREAPQQFQVPSGSQIELTYRPGQPPILAVRLQELFGMKETPRLARGRAPVLLHLLAPNMRPQQVTADLASFWENTYPQVRKDLRGRYPKHSWPEDPLSAEPLRGAKRRS